MRYKFIPVRLKDLDSSPGHILLVTLFEEDRPPHGLAGLVDWRTDGILSRFRLRSLHPNLENPHFQGMIWTDLEAGPDQKLLFPSGGRLPYDLICVYGLGSQVGYDGQKYRDAVRNILQSVAALNARQLTLQLPGWQLAGLPARRAADVFVSQWYTMKNQGVSVPADVCFVEHLEYQAEMDERIQEIIKINQGRR